MTDAFGGRGGIAQYNRDFLRAITEPENSLISSVTVLPRLAPDTALPTSSKIKQASPRAGRISYTIATLRAAMSSRFDIVFCGHIFMAPLAAMIAWLKGSVLIIQTHGIEVWGRPTRLQRAAMEAADLILSVSRHTRATVLSRAALAPERVVVLPDTVGEDFVPRADLALRSKLGLEGKRVLLTVGRLDSQERYKGHDRVIAAIPTLVTEGHDIAYIIIGTGGDRERLEGLASDVDVSPRVHFLGSVDRKVLIEAYRMADLFVMPSTGEGFGIAFLEAMACGIPALGLAVAGAKDPLADGELGIAITPQSHLASAISHALAKPRSAANELPRQVEQRFGRAVFTARANALIQRIITSTKEYNSLK